MTTLSDLIVGHETKRKSGNPTLGYTPEEQAHDEKYEASRLPQNLKELDAELARATDPKIRATLEAYREKLAGGPRAMPAKQSVAAAMSTPQYQDFFPVEKTRKRIRPAKVGTPPSIMREAFINGTWIEVEDAGKQVRDGKAVSVARLGKYAPKFLETLEYGAEKSLGGLTGELGKSIAAYRAGPGGGAALEEGERHELGLKYPKIVGTPYEQSKGAVLGGMASGVATDPLSYLGAAGGLKGMTGMGIVSGAGSQVAEGLREGHVSPAKVGVGGVIGGATGAGLGLVGPPIVRGAVAATKALGRRLMGFLRGEGESAAIPAEERKKEFMAILAAHKPTGWKREEHTYTDDEIDAINASLDEAHKRFGVGTADSKPVEKPELTAGKTRKTVQTGPIVEKAEGDLEQILPYGGKPKDAPVKAAETQPRTIVKPTPPDLQLRPPSGKVEPPIGGKTEPTIGALPEAPKPEFKQIDPASNVGGKPEPRIKSAGMPGAPDINYNKDSLLVAIKKLGGLNMSHMNDLIGEKVKARLDAVGAGAFKKDGRAFDDIREALAERGYIPPEAMEADGGIQWLQEAVRDEANGLYKHYSLKASEDVLYGRMRDQQGGIVTDLLMHMGTTSAGAVAGAAMDPEHPVRGAVTGAAVGLSIPTVAKRLIAGGPASMLTLMGKRDPLLKGIAREPIDQAEGEIAARGRETYQNWAKFKAYNLPIQDQEIIVHAIQAGRIAQLPPNLQPIAVEFQTLVGRLGTQGQQVGAIPNLGRNYVPQMWDTADPHTKQVLEKLGYNMDKEAGPEGFTTFTPFALPKGIPSYLAGTQQLQLKPKTYDLGDIYAMYATSVNRSIENTKALSMVRQLKDLNGKPLVDVQGSAPRDYVKLKNVPDMQDYRVHPEIAESLERALGSTDLHWIEGGLLGVSFTAKRMNTMYSMFHTKSLLEAYTLSGNNPLDFMAGAAARGAEKATGKSVAYKSGVDRAIEAYRTGGAGDAVDYLIRNGLSVKPPIEDVSGLGAYQKMIGDIPLLGPAATATDKKLQQFTWEYTHTGMKLATSMKLFEREMRKNPTADPNKVAADVSKFVNRTFGGLNWRREVEDVQNKWIHKAAATGTDPRGMAWQQIMMFAPDWKWSTFLSWAKAIPGVEESQITRELHQKYVATAVGAQLVFGDALNLYFSGHHLWENAKYRPIETMSLQGMMHEPTWHDVYEGMLYIDMGDGRKMNFMKHAQEVPHMVADPAQFAMNALGYVPRTVAESSLNKEWLSATYAPNISKDPKSAEGYAKRFMFHPVKRMTPFGAQQFYESGAESIGGFFGLPITGMTGDARMKQRLEDKLDRFKE